MGKGAQLFLITAAATFLGGIALAVVQPLILPAAEVETVNPDKLISVRTNEQFGLDGPAQAKIAKNIIDRLEFREVEDVGEIEFGIATIANEGEVDIPDFEATLVSRVAPEPMDFLAAGYMRESEYGDDTIHLDVGDGREVTVPIELLKSGESLTIWYVMSQNNIAEVKVREPNIDVVSDVEMIRRDIEAAQSSEESEDDGFSDWIFILIFSVAAFAAGAGLTILSYEDLLKKIGFEPKELMDAYKDQLAKEKVASKDD